MDESKGGIQLDTVIIFTRQMAQLAGWYQKALGLAPLVSSPGHLGQQVGSVYLGFDQVDEETAYTSTTGVTLWFAVEDIQSTFDRLIEQGAKVRYPPTEKPWGPILASVYDPDGNIIGISQPELPAATTRD